jgi:hypothetical protein
MRQIYFFLFLGVASLCNAQLVINETLFDPAGGSSGDANGDGTRNASEDEFIEFVNNSGTALDISGYKIYDATNLALLPGSDVPNHTVGAGVIIPANGIYVLFGGGTPTNIPGDMVEISTSGDLNLTNSDDVITVTDATGNVVVEFDSNALGLNMGADQSVMRNPNLTGDFEAHIAVNGDAFSPGVLAIDTTPDTTLVINEAFYDPASGLDGDANGDGNRDSSEDEFIEFVNNSNSPLDISGYKIYDDNTFTDLPAADNPRHEVPANTIIPANGIYVLFGGGMPTNIPGDVVQTSSSGDLNLTNGGDTITVTNTAGDILLIFDSAVEGLNMGSDQSAMRNPNVTGNFELHIAVNGDRFSPGVLAVDTTPDTTLIVNEVLYDPAGTTPTELEGDANGDGTRDTFEDEFIEFYNLSSSSLDISDYEIYDTRGLTDNTPRHIVPANTIIPANGTYVIFGGGDITLGDFGNSTVQIASSGQLNLTNGGDVITVKDNNDNVILVFDSAATGLDFGSDVSITRSPDITGSFVLHTTANSALDFSPGYTVNAASLTVDQIKVAGFKIFPNPLSNGILNVSNFASSESKLSIYNLTGQQIFTGETIQQKVDLSVLKGGVYLVRLVNENGTQTKKLIVQ